MGCNEIAHEDEMSRADDVTISSDSGGMYLIGCRTGVAGGGEEGVGGMPGGLLACG